MNTRVNVNIPEALFERGQDLVDKGFFSNFSELVREGLRKEIADYGGREITLSEEERKLLLLLKEAEKKGDLLTEKEMEEHGLKF